MKTICYTIIIIMLLPIYLVSKDFNERGVEYAFVLEQICTYYPKTVLDVGVGKSPLPLLLSYIGCDVTATDIKGGINKYHKAVMDDITDTQLTTKFDMVLCISTLEHIENYDAAIKNMFKLTRKGGIIVLTFPYTDKKFYGNVYVEKTSNVFNIHVGYPCHSFSRKQIKKWCRQYGGKLIKQTYYDVWTGNFWREGEQIIPPRKTTKKSNHQLTCITIKKE